MESNSNFQIMCGGQLRDLGKIQGRIGSLIPSAVDILYKVFLLQSCYLNKALAVVPIGFNRERVVHRE